jgi:hypothetical protein
VRNLGVLLAMLLWVAIALTPSLPQAQVLEPLCQCFCTDSEGDISVLIRLTGGDVSLCAETDGLPCFVCKREGTLSGCFAIYANPNRQIDCGTGGTPSTPGAPQTE